AGAPTRSNRTALAWHPDPAGVAAQTPQGLTVVERDPPIGLRESLPVGSLPRSEAHGSITQRHATEVAEFVVVRERKVLHPADLFEAVADFEAARRLPVTPLRAEPPVVRRGHHPAPLGLQAGRRLR